MKLKYLLVHAACCLSIASGAIAHAAQQPEPEPLQLVRSAAWNELHAHNSGRTFRYRIHVIDGDKDTVREVVETRNGDVARLLMTDGRALSSSEDAAERTRLEKLRADPDTMAKKQRKAHSDDERQNEMLKLLPDAFLYTSLGMAAGPNGPCYRLQFRPNPAFVPPDREAQVYHGMAGELWIDQAQKRMVRLDAHLTEDVNFGWGIAGQLFKGGTILVEQKDVGEGHWETTHMKLNLDGKILMLKSLTIHETDDSSEFAAVPNDGYQAAITSLLNMPTAP